MILPAVEHVQRSLMVHNYCFRATFISHWNMLNEKKMYALMLLMRWVYALNDDYININNFGFDFSSDTKLRRNLFKSVTPPPLAF